ncbi:hypothetical protein B0T26DRAFT_676061 [Lasiosphaeria miniovina]|uniref:Uncharacterized protein n=1 Tax=Lasiosphaeria miniovina TaxID=1954250 RepID=A0AA40DXZ7_9PEZI|nr:uncharacterized protein B0T26DRAFT_676061 [Lasiosphaeria miniovina]KAK0717802.1 hypothetical protein B0T26DRAFT_676061 [Lasiosphaeria miniovina]
MPKQQERKIRDGNGSDRDRAMASSTGVDIGKPKKKRERKDGNSGVFGRLLQRAKSTKGSKPPRQRADADSSEQAALVHSLREELKPAESGGSPPQSPLNSPYTELHPQPQQRTTERGAQAQPAAALDPKMPTPGLKKRASFRDRIRSWQKIPSGSLSPSLEESKSQFVYTPRHAAADFERLAVSPTSPPPRRMSSEARSAVPSPENNADVLVRPRRSPPLLQTLEETEAGAPALRTQSRPKRRETESPRAEPRAGKNASPPRHSRSRPSRDSYTVAEDAWEALQVQSPMQQAAAAALRLPRAPSLEPHVLDTRTSTTTAAGVVGSEPEPHPHSDAAPPSDYESFLARAQAKDRAHREQVLRSISQRSAELKPSPHLQYASASSSADMSAGSTVVAGQTPADESRSKSSRGGGDEQQQQQQPFRRGHAKRASWAPSFDASGYDAEKTLEKKSTSTAATRHAQQQQPIVMGVDDTFQRPGSRMGDNSSQSQQPVRTLRRQGSITQRIAEYIRPAREDIASNSNYEPSVYYRPPSRAGIRRSGSQMQQPIETLVE